MLRKPVPYRRTVLFAVVLLSVLLAIAAAAFAAAGVEEAGNVQDASRIVYEVIQCENDRNWEGLLSLWTPENRQDLRDFLKNNLSSKNNAGVLSVESANIVEIKELPSEVANAFTNMDKYREKYVRASLFYVGINYRVSHETKYYFNGVNYRIAVVVSDGSRWYLAELSDAPVEAIVSDGHGFGSRSEKIAERIAKARYKGLAVNVKGDVLENFSATPEQLSQERGRRTVPPDAGVTADEHTRPSSIRVYLTNSTNYTYYGYKGPTARAIDFYYYVKNVLPKEWISSWPAESLKAGAMATKMYGWYHVYHPKWPSLNADVKDNTQDQVFLVKSELNPTTQAINAVGGIGMEKASTHTLFEAQHWAGYYSDHSKSSGKMEHWGTKYWADSPRNKTYDWMCHYYYDSSPNTSYQLMAFFYY